MGTEALLTIIAGRATVTEVSVRGAGAARNGGVDLATGEFLAFTDSDCIPEPGWLAAALGARTNGHIFEMCMTVWVVTFSAIAPCEACVGVFSSVTAA